MDYQVPFNEYSERVVLGSMLIYSSSLIDGLGILNEEEFYMPAHSAVFTAIRKLSYANIPVDVQTVFEQLTNDNQIDLVGGLPYLQELVDSTEGSSNFPHYTRILKDQSLLRHFLEANAAIISEYVKEGPGEISDFIGRNSRIIEKISEKRRISEFTTTADITRMYEEKLRIADKSTSKSPITGVASGYDEIDWYTKGFQKGDLIYLAARPSVGKTALGVNFAFNYARRHNKPVAIFSLEMSSLQLIYRMLGMSSSVQLTHIQSFQLTNKDRPRVADALKNLSTTPIFIDDTPGLRLQDLIAKAKKLKNEREDLAMIVIDYIGLITTTDSRGKNRFESRQQEVSEISRSLKDLARTLNIPLLVLAQLSRDVTKRGAKSSSGSSRPVISDLRDSGSLEQDADVVMLIHREDYQKDSKDNSSKSPDETVTPPQDENISITEIIIGKNRNGPTGVTFLLFNRQFGKFDALATEELQKELLKRRAQQS